MVPVKYISSDFPVTELDDPAWRSTSEILIDTYWSGDKAPLSRHLTAGFLWSDTGLYVRFNAKQNEPLVMNDKPDLTRKTVGLWKRDVCEVFLAPDRSQPKNYFEFEIAPTGEWLDLKVEIIDNGRVTNWNYRSMIETAADIRDDHVLMTLMIPFESLGARPSAGDIWLGNVFRCVGSGPGRGYLAWQPTRTEIPNFHVPSHFGQFEFGE